MINVERNIFNLFILSDPNLSEELMLSALDDPDVVKEFLFGVKFVSLYAYAPYYFMPGINILYDDYLEFLRVEGILRRRRMLIMRLT